jgi:hypothetical protein
MCVWLLREELSLMVSSHASYQLVESFGLARDMFIGVH